MSRIIRATAFALLSALALVAAAIPAVVAQEVDTTPPVDGITFAFLLTAAGAGIAAGIVTALVELLKSVSPTLTTKLSGAALAFVLSAVLFVLAGVAVGVDSLDEGLVVFLAWLTCATSAVGIHSTLANRGTLLGGSNTSP